MSEQYFPWHRAAWQAVNGLRERMPHAILLHGPAGTGKSAFAALLAKSLLCEAPLQDGQACGACLSCGWFSQYSHPDFRRVRPEIFDDGDSDASDNSDADAEGETKKTAKSAKAPSREIKIEQIRAMAGFMNLSTHRNGFRIVLLYPAEALNTISANALLKTL